MLQIWHASEIVASVAVLRIRFHGEKITFFFFTNRTEHGSRRDYVIMCGVAGASTTHGHYNVNVHASQERANVNWESSDVFQLQQNIMAQHVRPEWA